jgi:hypothetical protein
MIAARRLLLVLATLAAGCLQTTESGTLRSTGSPLGEWTMTPTMCIGGGAFEFNGVDLSDGLRNVRLIDDPAKGFLVTVSPDGDPARPAVLLTPQGCARFSASLTGDPANDATGQLELDCDLGSGRFSGSVAFANCGT